jgi:hypothetical protein
MLRVRGTIPTLALLLLSEGGAETCASPAPRRHRCQLTIRRAIVMPRPMRARSALCEKRSVPIARPSGRWRRIRSEQR